MSFAFILTARRPAPSASLARVSSKSPLLIRTFVSRPSIPPALLTLADLSVPEISRLISLAQHFKQTVKSSPTSSKSLEKSLDDKTVALLFTKRSTRTRVASETATKLLGGHPMFLGPSDIQLGVNESLRDTSTVVGSMVDGIMARVGGHDEVEAFAKSSGVPVVNALSDLYHPTQILASLLTLSTIESAKGSTTSASSEDSKTPTWHSLIKQEVGEVKEPETTDPLACLKGLKVAWIGDSNNVLNDMLVSYPRLGIELAVASPEGYGIDPRVWKRVEEGGNASLVKITTSPEVALKDANYVVTDTWISMGQESDSAKRLKDFAGYQITEELCKRAGASPDWKFQHCLPRHQDEVDDEVFYGPRTTVWEEAENRKWTIMAVFHAMIGKWQV